MLNVLKGKIAIVLVISMVFSNAGMMTFASSVDDVVSAASIANGNNTHNYYEGNILKDKVEGDDVGASDFVGASYASPDDEEPEEDATIESSDNDENDTNDFYESTVENSESMDSIDSSENSEDIFESDKSESSETNKVEEGDPTSVGIEDGTIDSINESERVDDNSTSPNEDSSDPDDDSNFVETINSVETSNSVGDGDSVGESNSVGAKHRERPSVVRQSTLGVPAATTSDIAPSEDQNETDEEKLNNDVATNSDADEKDKVNIKLSTDSEVANNNLIATDSEFVKSVLEEELSTASEALEVKESTQSDIIALEDILSTKSSASLFGDTDKYILPANWTKGSGIIKKRIDKIEILYYGKDAPAWYNISWNIEGSNGLRAYKKSSYIYMGIRR